MKPFNKFERRQQYRELPMINERIRAREVRLISEKGEMLGVLPTLEAVRIAKDRGYDLVIVSSSNEQQTPVAKIMDYGKFKFEAEKKAKEAKKKQHVVDVKEIKMSYKIDKHDYDVNVKKAERFLTHGDKVKVTIALRGREMEHKNLAMELLARFVIDTASWGTSEKHPKMEGKNGIVILNPLPHKK